MFSFQREELLYCLALCERLDNNYLQHSPYIIQSHFLDVSVNFSERNQVEPYGAFNFRTTEEFQEATTFIEKYNQLEIERCRQDIEEEINRDVLYNFQMIQVRLIPENIILISRSH